MDNWICVFKTKSLLSFRHSHRKNKIAHSGMVKELNGLHRWLNGWHKEEILHVDGPEPFFSSGAIASVLFL